MRQITEIRNQIGNEYMRMQSFDARIIKEAATCIEMLSQELIEACDALENESSQEEEAEAWMEHIKTDMGEEVA